MVERKDDQHPMYGPYIFPAVILSTGGRKSTLFGKMAIVCYCNAQAAAATKQLAMQAAVEL